MNVTIFSFTKNAAALSIRLFGFFSKEGIPCTAYTLPRFAENDALCAIKQPLSDYVSASFLQHNVLIFVSACGIAVRSIAPFIKDKSTDPCVLCIDELGHFVIPLLSGHIGRGNEFAKRIADTLNATPVLSTATDLHNRFAVDVFAQKNGLTIHDKILAKEISARMLEHKPVGVYGDFKKENLPDGLLQNTSLPIGFTISERMISTPFEKTLYLIPKNGILGIGCRKNTSSSLLFDFINALLEKEKIFKESIKAITSITLKKDEPAIKALAQTWNVPFYTYDASTLNAVSGNFHGSAFVKETIGTDNVCERSCIAYDSTASILIPKTAKNGITAAFASIPYTLTCEPNHA